MFIEIVVVFTDLERKGIKKYHWKEEKERKEEKENLPFTYHSIVWITYNSKCFYIFELVASSLSPGRAMPRCTMLPTLPILGSD
jgi:hypothetical protein